MKRIHLLMLALEAYIASIASPAVLFFAEFAVQLEQLTDELAEINEKMQGIQAKADAENRDLTTEEDTAMNELFARFETVEIQIERRKRLQETSNRVASPGGRRTEPNPLNDEGAGGGNDPAQRPNQTRAQQDRNGAGASRARITGVRDLREDDRSGGFRSVGEFAQCVKVACAPAGRMDPRLIVLNAAPTHSSEGVGADGGFAVPPDFRTAIMEKVQAPVSLIGRTDQLVSSSNTITIPKDETTPWQSSGGIQAYWEGEAQQKTASKVALQSMSIKLNKLSALVNVTDELMEDAPALSAYIRRKAPIKIDYKITDGILNGTGVGMPQGLLTAACKVTVPKESGQAAASVVFNNIVKMWARMYAGCRPTSAWLMNQDIEPSLFAMQFPGSGTAVPVYLPPGGLSNAPFGTLMGRPVIPVEACQTLGTEGDLILVDLQSYMTAMKVGGIRQDVSMHLYFDYDITAFKFVLRVAGQPWWSSAITPAQGNNTRSCIVTLQSR